jgi:hypothetical protein
MKDAFLAAVAYACEDLGSYGRDYTLEMVAHEVDGVLVGNGIEDRSGRFRVDMQAEPCREAGNQRSQWRQWSARAVIDLGDSLSSDAAAGTFGQMSPSALAGLRLR